ncbi:MAG: hypothetical protein ACXU8U_09860, partial [Asticcacaulis sp.]
MVDIGKTGQAPAAIGLRAYKGGALAVAVCVTGEGPRVLYSTTLKSHAETEPLSLEPYAIAYRMAHEQGVSRKDIEAAVARGREIQVEAARDSLRSLADRVTALGHPGVSVALLVNRATWMTDLVEYSL